jgi:hypothetical protein
LVTTAAVGFFAAGVGCLTSPEPCDNCNFFQDGGADTGGSPGSGGATGGQATGGSTGGGTGLGGAASGGIATGGSPTGGIATGGSGGGGATGGAKTGGMPMGGTATGGIATGGVAGAATGGAPKGGMGGVATGGAAGGAMGGAGGGNSPLNVGLVLHYAFDESTGTTAADAAGDRDGTLMAGGSGVVAAFSTTHQVGTHAVNLTGATGSSGGGYVNIPASLQTLGATTTLTIACWVNLRSQRAWQRIFDFAVDTNTYLNLTTNQNLSTPNSVRFSITTSGYMNEQRIDMTTPATLSTAAWHHIAVVLGPGTTYTGTLYIDGVAAGSNTAMTMRPSAVGNSTNNFIGRSVYTADPYFDGFIDDFRIYNRALSASEITSLYGLR